MPLNKSAFYRYLLIDKRINDPYKKPYPSLQELLNYIIEKSGQIVSKSQLEKDISEMRHGEILHFYAPLEYSKKENGYFYAEKGYSIGHFVKLSADDYNAIDLALNVIDAYKEVDVFNHFKETVNKLQNSFEISKTLKHKKVEQIVLMETNYFAKGTHFITQLIQFIKNKESILLSYTKFKGEMKVHDVSPLLIKEHDNRWYVITYNSKVDDFQTFGLDRIQEIKPSKAPYSYNKNIAAIFDNVIGVTMPYGAKVVKIDVWFEPLIAHYLLTNHLHHSQKVKSQNKKGVIFSFELIPNNELKRALLSWGQFCKVLKPKSFVQIMKEEARLMNENYQ